MKVILAEHYGICFGVRDAIRTAEQLAAQGPITILGELVHNPGVRNHLQSLGATEGDLDADAQTPRVMITAHGASDADRVRWSSAGFEVADTTCPLVHFAHRQLQRLVDSGYFPVVIGKRGHVEVRGLVGNFPCAHVMSTVVDLETLPAAARYGVISQTTQPTQHVQELVEALRMARPDAEVRHVDTVCKPTKDRQSAMERLIAQVEVLVVVGGRNSNNTRQLAERAIRAGLIAHHVETAAEIDPAWFEGVCTVGLTAGTSTPEADIQAVKRALEALPESVRSLNEEASALDEVRRVFAKIA